jgi:hypothetical protein
MKTKDGQTYGTFMGLRTKDDRYIFISDIDSLREYNKDIGARIAFAGLFFKTVLFVEFIVHLAYSYSCINDISRRVGRFTYTHTTALSTKIVLTSYLIHTVLIFSYFILGYIILNRPRRAVFMICEIYLMVKLVSDVLFSLFNYYHVLFMCECVINLVVIKYMRFLHIELNKVNYEV